MKVKIVCESEKYLPTYANETDACMDLKVKLNNGLEFDTIEPNETKVFGTGIKVAVPVGHVMQVFPRSSTGIKMKLMLTNTTGIIDSGYRDEIKMALTNFGDKTVGIMNGQRVAQFMILPFPKIELDRVNDDMEFRQGDRLGGIGSSGVM